ncbi:MAG: MBL fold metallo-hydrolase [Ardenticatenaceae bacterium]|nr:MBL fold metallo-hydrolase [Ardenticatenaceae bacterium]MCB8986836.1 MBL fold metallo-hydrolase [Ardenticatenaceae bacterium]
MQIQFFGAARTVTGSQHLVTVNGRKILLDCGLYQGSRQESYHRNQQLPFDAASVDVLVLSHAHMDHSGNIPNLVKSGFQGDIICTYATRDLCAVMLRDSAKIQSYDVQYLNKKRERKNLPPIDPIYTMEDAVESLKQFIGLGYGRPYKLFPGVTLTFYDAGHILGSAIVALDIEDEESQRNRRLVFSGDLGRPNRPILRDPALLDRADILIIESTYGNRLHADLDEASDKLENIINETYGRGGKLIVPAFAVGRTQELVYRIHQLVEERDIPPKLPIFVDSPLAIDATGIYRLHPEAYDEEIAQFILANHNEDPFGFDMMHYTRSTAESKELNFLREPAVIISASGMAEAGRILHHLKNNIEDARNTILIVGWQAPNTLGRRLVEKQPVVKIFGEEYRLKAQVETINGFSAHADRKELLEWTGHLQQRPSHTFIVHGEEEAAFSFAAALQEEQHLPNVVVPELGQKFTL